MLADEKDSAVVMCTTKQMAWDLCSLLRAQWVSVDPCEHLRSDDAVQVITGENSCAEVAGLLGNDDVVIRILVGTTVVGTGINLQGCRLVYVVTWAYSVQDLLQCFCRAGEGVRRGVGLVFL